ncbi:hypothetical protein ACVIGB_000532 [Bradyrhizobium sp. USDA 4341]
MAAVVIVNIYVLRHIRVSKHTKEDSKLVGRGEMHRNLLIYPNDPKLHSQNPDLQVLAVAS